MADTKSLSAAQPRKWVPVDESSSGSVDQSKSGGNSEYEQFIAQNKAPAQAQPKAVPQQEPRLSLGQFAQQAVDSTVGAAIDAGSAVAGMFKGNEQSLPVSDGGGARIANTGGLPIDQEVFTQIKSELGAMPRDQRMAAANLPGWKGRAAKVAIEQLDNEQAGVDRLKLGSQSPTLEGRAGFYAGQGANHEVAQSKATSDLVAGAPGGRLHFAQDGGATAAADAQARTEGREIQNRSLGVRAGYAASEGLKAGSQGVVAAAMRAMGDDETANALELSARRSKIRVDSVNELVSMRRRAQEDGTVAGHDGFWEDMSVGGLSSAAQNVPQIGAGVAMSILTKNPAAGTRLAMGLMTGQSFGDEYINGRMAGMTPGKAASRAGIMAGFEYFGERYGLIPSAMKAVRGNASKVPLEELPQFLERFVGALEKRGVLGPQVANVARGQLGEQFGEQLTTAGQYWIDGTGLGLDKPVSISGYLEAARDTAIQTLIATGALQGAGAGASHVVLGKSDRPTDGPSSYQADAAQGNAIAKWQQAFAKPASEQAVLPTEKETAPNAVPISLNEGAPQSAHATNQIDEVPQGSLASAALAMTTPVDEAAHQAATSPTNDLAEPTQAQKEAGNYKVGRARIGGMDIRIENPEGSVRKGVDADGQPWETQMRHHYGYFSGTMAADGDKLDVFVKPGLAEDWSGPVFVIDQIDPKTGELDEHKAVMGAADEAEAEQIYRSNYDANWQGLGAITRLPMPAFKAWAKSGRLNEPLGDIANAPQLAPNRKPAAESLAATSEAPQNEQKPSQAPTPAPAEAAPEKGYDPTGNTQAAGGAGELGLSGTRSVAAEASRVSKQRVKKHPAAVRGSGALAEVSRALGGLSPDLLSDLSEKTTRTRVSKTGKKTNYIQWDNPAIPGVGPLFRKGGTSDLSEVARVLEESGYLEPGSVERDPLSASQRAHEIIRGELREGGSTVRVGNADAIEAEMRARMDELMDDGPDPWDDFTLTPEDLEESGYYDLNDDVRAATEQLIAEAEQLGIDTESIREDMARLVGEEASQDEYHAATQEAIRAAITEAAGHARQTESAGAGTSDRSGLETVGQTDREGSPVQDRDSGSDREGLSLQSQTEDDLREKAQREQDAAKAEATKKAAEQERLRKADEARENKARADATVDAFELGQSADAQLSGMADLFGGQETTKQTTKDSGTDSSAQAKVSSNSIFTDDAAEKARALLKKKLGQLNSGIDPELLQAGITLAGYHIERGARTFAAYASAMIGDLGEAVRPYLKSWYMGVKYDPRASGFDGMSGAAEVEAADLATIGQNAAKENNDVSDASNDLERNRQNQVGDKRVLAGPDGNESGQADDSIGEAGGRAGTQGRGRRSDSLVPTGGSIVERERGDQPVSSAPTVDGASQLPAGADVDQRGGGFGDAGIPVETVSADATRGVTQDGLAQGLKNRQQRLAPTSIKLADLDNVRETLPLLQEKQQEDVHKAEVRFGLDDGYGMLFTNGTGTGKTYTGLGVVKRYALQGKTNVLMVAPSDKIIEDWITSGARLGLTITKLGSTAEAGTGLVITTYANFGDNLTLADREWDLVVTDEAHYLMQAEDGKTTKALSTLRAITMHPDGVSQLVSMRHRVSEARLVEIRSELKALSAVAGDDGSMDAAHQKAREQQGKLEAEQNKLIAKLNEAREEIKQEIAGKQGPARPRAVFLSATPWAYVPTVDWANGYLFDYDEGQKSEADSFRGYNEGSNRERFFMRHFGYRMRYNRLTRPDAKVNVSLMERQFNAWLRKSGALSARMLDVKADYDRRFVLIESAIGTRIDEALNWISERARGNKEQGIEADEGARVLSDVLSKRFDYLSRRYLLEAIKAQESLDYVRKHLALGRKVVVFHDYKKGGGFNPFDQPELSTGGDEIVTPEKVEKYNAALREFKSEFSDLIRYPFAAMPSPIEAYKKAFPGVLLFNGDVSPKDRRAAVAKFQSDDTGPSVILVQSAAGKEGISLHDTTGKYQRALLNLGQPTQPTTAIQQEGRIYRTGQVTNAIQRYFSTGTNWEKWAFATTIAQRASTAENLGMGEQARALKDSFIAAYEEADVYEPGHEGEGQGGKERDRASHEALTEFDRAVSFYYGTQKKNSKTKAAEGADYFATPEPLGLKMVEWLDAHGGDHLLEPSAGHGAIARWLPENTERTAVEPSGTLRPRLAMVYDGRIVDSLFEDFHIVNKFDGIVMNPPFGVGGKTAIEHLAKAADHLRDGGRIVALIPTGPAADKRFDKWFYEEDTKPARPIYTDERLGAIYEGDTLVAGSALGGKQFVVGHVDKHPDGRRTARSKGDAVKAGIWLNYIDKVQPGSRKVTYRPADGLHLVANIKLPQVAFERAGTSVATRVVVIEKPRDGESAPAQRNVDFGDANSVEDFFKQIRDYGLPSRAKPAATSDEVAAPDQATAPREERNAAKIEKAEARQGGMQAATEAGMQLVEHVTQKGKTLKGVVRSDLTKAQAQEIDKYTFKKDNGWFIRSEHVPALLSAHPLKNVDVDGDAQFSAFRSGEVPDGLAIGKDELSAVIDGALEGWRGIGRGQVIAAESWRDLPEEVLQSAERLGLGVSKLEGVLHRGRVYLVRSAIKSREQAERIVFHEVLGHLGVKAALGGQTTGTLDDLWYRLNGLAGVAKIAKKHEAAPGVSVWQRLQPYIKGTEGADQTYRRAVIMDELIAYLAQAKDTSVLTQFKGYLSDLKSSVVKLLRRFGLETLANKLEQAGAELDALALVRDARASIMSGKTRAGQQFVFVSQGQSLNPAFSKDTQFSLPPEHGAAADFTAFDVDKVGEGNGSAIGNDGSFDSGNPDIRFSVSGGRFALPGFGRANRFIEAIQNRYNRWKQTIDSVQAQGGTVNEANDFYAAEERYWGIVGAQMDDFKGEVDQFVKDVQADGLELDDVALYAYALHAPERNARIAQINTKFPDGGSGMTDAQAQAILDKAKADGLDGKLSQHAKRLQSWTQGTRDVLLRNGLISQDEFDAWSQGYQSYVPLRGQIGDDGSRQGTGSGFDIRGKESFRAMGRRSQAAHVVEHILQDRARALIRSGKNEVLRRFARFVLDNPDTNLWQVNAVKHRRSMVKTPMGEQVVEWDELNTDRDDTVALKDGGQVIYITVKDQVLLKQLKNLHDEARLPVVVESLHWANRLLSRMYTSLSPVFTILNGARDVTAGSINMIGLAGYGGAAKMLANLPGAYKEAFRAEFKKQPSTAYDDYRRTGGKTGFMDFKDIEGYAKELADMAQEAQTWRQVAKTHGARAKAAGAWKKARGTTRKVLERIEGLNGAVENATRFAAFKAARESGKTLAESASIAKNITVNFNRRGDMTPVLSSWFLFFNPAVQGTARMVQALRSREVQKVMGGAMVGLFGLALMNAAVGGDDDDDGMTYWDKIPDEVKERNLIIMLPPGSDQGEEVGEHGRYLKIPMPYGYNTFAVLATTMADMLRHQGNPLHGVSAGRGALRVFKSFVGSWLPVSDVSPSFENQRAVALIGVPDALDPIVEPALNINGFGKQLYPEGMGQDRLPDSEKVFGAQKNTWKHGAARWLNEATGGSLYHEGAISVTPATIDNVVRGYGGGVASFITSLADTVVTQGIARDRVEWWRAPFVKQLYGEVGATADQSIAYDRLSEIERASDPLKRAIRAGDQRAAEAISGEFGPIAKLGPVAQAARDRLTLIRKREVRVIESETMTNAEKNMSLRQWDQERQKVYDSVNRAWGQVLQDQ